MLNRRDPPESANFESWDKKPAAVITGAASGIGRELAQLAVREGLVLLVDRSGGQLNDLVDDLTAKGLSAAAVCVDLADPEAVPSIEVALRERGWYCDVLVNSAGFGVFGPACKLPTDEQLNLLDVNIRALSELTLRFLPAMVARGRGGILNVGSIAGYAQGGPYMAVYYASKAYVNSFSAALAAELGGTGVTVTCLVPGVVKTPFFERCSGAQTRLFKRMPHSTAAKIARAGWRGFKTGKRIVIPQLRNRMILAMTRLIPEDVVLRKVGRGQRPR